MALDLVTIPCLKDNYAYLIRDKATGETALVDAPEAAPILAELTLRRWQLDKIFLTHHLDDHVQGTQELVQATQAAVYGAQADEHRGENHRERVGRATQEQGEQARPDHFGG